VEESLSMFVKKIFEKIVFTTMNGNKSNGYYYLGRKYYIFEYQ